MIRLLFFVALVLVLGVGFAWLADRPGDVTLVWQDTRFDISLMAAVTGIVALIAAIMITWWIIKIILTSPQRAARFFRARKRDRGYQALSTGLIAAGAGDAALARKLNKRTKSLLSSDQEPLIHLLDVQAALIEGRNDEARGLFEAMAEDPETRLLGLRGLYLEAQRLGADDAARHYAEKAAEEAPHLPWAGSAALSFRTREGKWDDALRLLERQRQAGSIDKSILARRKAVLLTARGRDQIDSNPAAARDDGLAALKLVPDFVPAAVVAAKALFREDNLKKGSRTLEGVWKAMPHPEIAETYVAARIGDSVLDRLKRAERLETLKPHHAESFMAVARAALDARKFDLARTKAESAARLDPRENVYLLLADIEEAETGDQGRVRYWLSQALRAPRDRAWTAGSYVAEQWEPVSPVTGEIDAFVWKTPVEMIGGPAVDHQREGQFDRIQNGLPPLARPAEHDAKPQETIGGQPVIVAATAAAVTADAVPSEVTILAATEIESDARRETDTGDEQGSVDVAGEVGVQINEERAQDGSLATTEPTVADPESAAGSGVERSSTGEEGNQLRDEAEEREAEFFSHRPDDPGVNPNRALEPKPRFRLF